MINTSNMEKDEHVTAIYGESEDTRESKVLSIISECLLVLVLLVLVLMVWNIWSMS